VLRIAASCDVKSQLVNRWNVMRAERDLILCSRIVHQPALCLVLTFVHRNLLRQRDSSAKALDGDDM
jgi:hypothetical protein